MPAFINLVLMIVAGAALAAANDCKKSAISQHRLPSSFEPSDILWDKRTQKLWVVSDGGELASMTHDGNTISYWTFDDKPDLEGIVQIPGREKFVYLQSEVTQQLLEFNTVTEELNAKYQLQGPGHLEAVAWVQVNETSTGFLYAGGQAAGTVHVHTLDFEEGRANFVEQFSLPAPNPGDLSALYYQADHKEEREYLTALYDRHRLMVLYVRAFGVHNHSSWDPIKKWQMPDMGSEGITWAEVDGTTYFFVCIDTAKRTVPKVRAVHRYTASELDTCFNATFI